MGKDYPRIARIAANVQPEKDTKILISLFLKDDNMFAMRILEPESKGQNETVFRVSREGSEGYEEKMCSAGTPNTATETVVLPGENGF